MHRFGRTSLPHFRPPEGTLKSRSAKDLSLVGATGFEPATSRTRTGRAGHRRNAKGTSHANTLCQFRAICKASHIIAEALVLSQYEGVKTVQTVRRESRGFSVSDDPVSSVLASLLEHGPHRLLRLWVLFRAKQAASARRANSPRSSDQGIWSHATSSAISNRGRPEASSSTRTVPVAVTAGESVEKLRQWASGRCLSAERPGTYSREGNGMPRSGRSVHRGDPNGN
jgi:hypothetical protein